MKIAITYEQQQIFQHFGKCPGFMMIELQDGVVAHQEYLDANGNGHSALVNFLQEQGIDTLVCGGIGQGARDALEQANITLISGAKGHIDIIINKLTKGTLVDDPSGLCNHHHEGEHNCGEEHHC